MEDTLHNHGQSIEAATNAARPARRFVRLLSSSRAFGQNLQIGFRGFGNDLRVSGIDRCQVHQVASNAQRARTCAR